MIDYEDDLYLELRKLIKEVGRLSRKYPYLYKLYLRLATETRRKKFGY